MKLRTARGSGATKSPLEPIESFLVRYVETTPGSKFATIIRAAEDRIGVSRSTAARHLSRLVRFGDLRVLPDRTYTTEDPASSGARTVVEVRWFDTAYVIYADGSARVFIQEEFRVVSGQLEHFEMTWPKPPRQFIWWCTAPCRVSPIPSERSSNRLFTHYVKLETPLRAREASWERWCVNVDLPQWYRMVYDPPVGSRGRPTPDGPAFASEGMETPAHGERLSRRLASDAHLRMRMVLPERYPIGASRFSVRVLAEPDRSDPVEERRIARLARDDARQDGFRRFGTTLTLSIPQPLLDRRYEVQWMLPTRARRDLWSARPHRYDER